MKQPLFVASLDAAEAEEAEEEAGHDEADYEPRNPRAPEAGGGGGLGYCLFNSKPFNNKLSKQVNNLEKHTPKTQPNAIWLYHPHSEDRIVVKHHVNGSNTGD